MSDDDLVGLDLAAMAAADNAFPGCDDESAEWLLAYLRAFARRIEALTEERVRREVAEVVRNFYEAGSGHNRDVAEDIATAIEKAGKP
jgi:acyl-CoA reductase-like NAD-dependent aldehyde dehydrogenase